MLTHVTIEAVLKVKDREKALDGIEKLSARVKNEPRTVTYGFVKMDEDIILAIERYQDAAAFTAHLENTGDLMPEWLEAVECVKLTGISPKSETEALKAILSQFGMDDKIEYYEIHGEGGIYNLTKTEAGEAAFCKICPLFTVLDAEKLEEGFIKPLMEGTAKETSTCLHYSIYMNGDKLFFDESYVNGEAVNTHVGQAGPAITSAIEKGIVKLESLSVFGPAAELDVTRPVMDGLGSTYKEWIKLTSSVKMAC